MTVSPSPELVERVARAIERAWSRNHASIRSDPDIAWKVWTPEAEAALESAQAEIARLRDAAERGLEWAIDAANERKSKDAVFENAMKDIRRIEAALKDSPNVG
jgi:Na+/phosphate symporter